MNATFKILITLLLCAGTGYAFANPGWARKHAENRQQNKSQAQETRRQEIRNQDSNVNLPPSHYESGNRRNGRMSLEERRALRRQINEVGQTIY